MKQNLNTGYRLDAVRKSAVTASRSVVALLVALLIGGIIITLGGYSFWEVYVEVFRGALGTPRGIWFSLATATPLMFTGLGFAIGFRVGIINVGLEGQLLFGGLAAALVGAYFPMPTGIHAAFSMLAGGLAGASIGALMGWFKIKFNAPEVITGIMLNSILALGINWLTNGPLLPPGAGSPQTQLILPTAELPRLVPRTQLTAAFIVAVLFCILIYFMQNKTTLGYKTLTVGRNPRAATVAGISSARMYLFSLALSGAMAGFAGAGLSLGVFRRYIDPIAVGTGFQGIPVSALAGHNPIGVILSALLFGTLRSGSTLVNQHTNIPFEFVDAVMALVVVFVAAPSIIVEPFQYLRSKFGPRKAKSAVADTQ